MLDINNMNKSKKSISLLCWLIINRMMTATAEIKPNKKKRLILLLVSVVNQINTANNKEIKII